MVLHHLKWKQEYPFRPLHNTTLNSPSACSFYTNIHTHAHTHTHTRTDRSMPNPSKSSPSTEFTTESGSSSSASRPARQSRSIRFLQPVVNKSILLLVIGILSFWLRIFLQKRKRARYSAAAAAAAAETDAKWQQQKRFSR